MRRAIVPFVIGAVGAAILLALGVWQLQRLEQKQTMIDAMEARIGAEPGSLPAAPRAGDDLYAPVVVDGRYLPDALHVLTSIQGVGPGFRVMAPFETADGRRIMVERGFLPETRKEAELAAPGDVTVTGNLHWPDETDSFTPEPDLEENVWYARDVPRMAEALGTEEVLVVAREGGGAELVPQPLESANVRNDHLEYALTWFALAAIWVGMTAFWLWRIRRRSD